MSDTTSLPSRQSTDASPRLKAASKWARKAAKVDEQPGEREALEHDSRLRRPRTRLYSTPSPSSYATLERLPDEILLVILRQLDASELLAVALTSRRLRGVAQTPLLWRFLLHKDYNVSFTKRPLKVKKEKRNNFRSPGDYRWMYGCIAESHIAVPSHTAPREEGSTIPLSNEQEMLYFIGKVTDGGCDATERIEGPGCAGRSKDSAVGAEGGDAEGGGAEGGGEGENSRGGTESVFTSRYWVGNMFSPTKWDAYCSMATYNVHCLALLQTEPARVDERVKEWRQYIIERSRVAASHLFQDRAELELNRWSTAELEMFFVEMWGLYSDGGRDVHNIGQLMFHGLRGTQREEEEARVRNMVGAIQRQGPSPVKIYGEHANSGVLSTKNVPSPVFSWGTIYGLINEIQISRVGQFSCPVSVGCVLLGCAWHPDDTTTSGLLEATKRGYCAVLDDMATLDDVRRAADLKCGRLPPIHEICGTDQGTYVTFHPPQQEHDGRSLELRPIVWFQFSDKETAMRHAEERQHLLRRRDGSVSDPQDMNLPRGDEDRHNPDEFVVQLWKPHVGNVCCAKLICPEDLLDEHLDEHEQPNVDINGVWFRGKRVELPSM